MLKNFQLNPERVEWSEAMCEIITKGSVFAECRKYVTDYNQYYKNCREDSCG